MDLIHMNAQKEDEGILLDYTFDLAFGKEENDFECTIIRRNHCCEIGDFLYYEGSEYGGMIDSVKVNTEKEEVTYSGRTWHGIIESKVIEPDGDYLTLSGEANEVLQILIDRLGLADIFSASSEDSAISISYKMNRYVAGYTGIRKMLKASGAKLHITVKNGVVILSAIPFVDYSKDEQFESEQIDFVVKKKGHPINHVICLGAGNLSEREVIHVYADENGCISTTQTQTGIAEVVAVYDYPNAESSDALMQGGIDLLEESYSSDEIDFKFDSNDETYDVGDIVGAKEEVTGIAVNAEITKKIVKISNNTTTISYKVGE